MLHKRVSNNSDWDATWSAKILRLRIWLKFGRFSASESSIAWKLFARLEIFSRLGMAHTCCKVGDGWERIELVTADEVNELREEDLETVLVQELDGFMKEYETMEQSFTGSHEEFLAAWWSHANQRLHFNHMREGLRESAPTWFRSRPKEYFDSGEEVFYMNLDVLRDYCKTIRTKAVFYNDSDSYSEQQDEEY